MKDKVVIECQDTSSEAARKRLPPWFKVRIRKGKDYAYIDSILKDLGLHTVCKGASCPNIWECWNRGRVTFMILGDVCTRNCSFCGVEKGRPLKIDKDEGFKVAEAVKALNLNYVVITSVTRDDLYDGGASVFASTIEEIKRTNPSCKVEVLIPDLKGSLDALTEIVSAGPDVLGHNMETVRRLYPLVRPEADYEVSLGILRKVNEMDKDLLTKSGLIIGFGETLDELIETIEDISKTGCNILTIGQYLRPSKRHYQVMRFYHPKEFIKLKDIALKMGFFHVEAGPLVRSSYHADLYCL